MGRRFVIFFAIGTALFGQERKVEPTWLYRNVPTLAEHHADFSSDSCRYTPIFGEGDVESGVPKSVARFGELSLAPGGSCQAVAYPSEEELYFILSGSG